MVRPSSATRSYCDGPRCRCRRLRKMLASGNFQHFPGRPLHQVEPIAVLGRRVVVRPLILGQVQAILITIDHQRHLGNVAIVEPIAGDAQLRRPAAEVPGAFAQPAAKDIRLFEGLLRQAAKCRPGDDFADRRRGWGSAIVAAVLARGIGLTSGAVSPISRSQVHRLPPGLTSGGLPIVPIACRDVARRNRRRSLDECDRAGLRAIILVIRTLDAAVIELPPPVGLLAQQGLEIRLRRSKRRTTRSSAGGRPRACRDRWSADSGLAAHSLAVRRIADDAAIGALAA